MRAPMPAVKFPFAVTPAVMVSVLAVVVFRENPLVRVPLVPTVMEPTECEPSSRVRPLAVASAMMMSPSAGGMPGLQFAAFDQFALVVPFQVVWAESGRVIGTTMPARPRQWTSPDMEEDDWVTGFTGWISAGERQPGDHPIPPGAPHSPGGAFPPLQPDRRFSAPAEILSYS